MKKFLLTLLVAVLSMTAAQAQIVKGLEYPRAHFGIRGAFTYNTLNGDHFDYDGLPFASGGFAVDFRIAPIPLYLETGTYYVNRGCKYEMPQYNGRNYTTEKETDSNHSVVVPLLVSYHLYFTDNLSIQPFTGAYVGYGFDAEEVDYGIRVGCGFNYGRLYANLGYDFGLQEYGNDNTTANTFFLTVGFNFAGSY